VKALVKHSQVGNPNLYHIGTRYKFLPIIKKNVTLPIILSFQHAHAYTYKNRSHIFGSQSEAKFYCALCAVCIQKQHIKNISQCTRTILLFIYKHYFILLWTILHKVTFIYTYTRVRVEKTILYNVTIFFQKFLVKNCGACQYRLGLPPCEVLTSAVTSRKL
jgi:hypothetical protein